MESYKDRAATRADEADGALGHRMHEYVEQLQRRICKRLADLDGRMSFRMDSWMRPGGGGGITATMEEGKVFEKAGVNISAVHGALPPRLASALETRSEQFYATGLSLVIHPVNPYVPTVHANVRYFALGDRLEEPSDEWFGGGADLTPYYPTLQDVRHFHQTWKDVCDRHPTADYGEFKRECDDYFFLPHRGEARGVGGIFFDYLRQEPEKTFQFVRDAGDAFLESYVPIVERHANTPFGEPERAYQELRRGRYVEFNLLYDRGTKFGIETRGRTESILMSLPPHVRWSYDWKPDPGTKEARAQWYFQPREWLSLSREEVPD